MVWYASSFDRQGRPTPAKQSINSPSLFAACERNISFPSCTPLLFSSRRRRRVGPLVFWAREAYHIFPFRRLWSMASRARPDSSSAIQDL